MPGVGRARPRPGQVCPVLAGPGQAGPGLAVGRALVAVLEKDLVLVLDHDRRFQMLDLL